MNSTINMQDYVKREMRFLPEVRVRQSFRVEGRGFNIAKNPYATPIVINSFNRLEYLRMLLDALRSRGYENVYIIDNASTYEPLLDFYERERLRVFYLDKNVGYLALWKTPIGQYFTHNYYVYTDPDIVPTEECPDDFVSFFHSVLTALPDACKVGFGLKIDDLPEHNPLREYVIAHEMRFWTTPLTQNLYAASIDTTFALYRPRQSGGWWLPALRTAGDYMARHMPWYENPQKLSDELKFYRQVCETRTDWSELARRTVDEWPPVSDLLPWTTESALQSTMATRGTPK